MLAGASPERQQEYENLVQQFRAEGRYAGREEEVAARIVNKQRAQYGETQEALEKDAQGLSPDRHLPIPNYEQMNAEEVAAHLEKLDPWQLWEVLAYEKQHLNRATVIEALERRMD
jgi:hypothetical protein